MSHISRPVEKNHRRTLIGASLKKGDVICVKEVSACRKRALPKGLRQSCQRKNAIQGQTRNSIPLPFTTSETPHHPSHRLMTDGDEHWPISGASTAGGVC